MSTKDDLLAAAIRDLLDTKGTLFEEEAWRAAMDVLFAEYPLEDKTVA